MSALLQPSRFAMVLIFPCSASARLHWSAENPYARFGQPLQAGYRLIDTAENYRNEDAVGQAIRANRASTALRSSSPLSSIGRWHSLDGRPSGVRGKLAAAWASTTSTSCWCTGRTLTKIVTSTPCKASRQSWTTVDFAPSARRTSNQLICSGCRRKPGSSLMSIRSSSARTRPGAPCSRIPQRSRHRHGVVEPARCVKRRAGGATP